MFKEMLRMANVDPDKTSVGEALRRAAKAVPGVQKIADMLPEGVRDVEVSSEDRTDPKA
jgi:hypothetical protein